MPILDYWYSGEKKTNRQELFNIVMFIALVIGLPLVFCVAIIVIECLKGLGIEPW